MIEPTRKFTVAGGKEIWYLDRATWGGGEVGAKFATTNHGGYPIQLPAGNFHGLVVHHTVFALADWDNDGFIRGDLDDVAKFMRRLQEVRAYDLGPEVPYSFVAFRHPDPNIGILCEGRGLGRQGAHTRGRNHDRYGVAIAGNTSQDPITPGITAAVRWVGAWLPKDPAVLTTTGHKDWDHNDGHRLGPNDPPPTACPGDDAYNKLVFMQPPFTVEDLTMHSRLLSEIAKLPHWARSQVTRFQTEFLQPNGEPIFNLDRPAEEPIPAEDMLVLLARVIDMLRDEQPLVGPKGERGERGPKGDRGERGPRGFPGGTSWWRRLFVR